MKAYPVMTVMINTSNEFLKATRLCYSAKTDSWISNMTYPEYVQSVKRALEVGASRADNYLVPKTKSLILDIVQKAVILPHAGLRLYGDV